MYFTQKLDLRIAFLYEPFNMTGTHTTIIQSIIDYVIIRTTGLTAYNSHVLLSTIYLGSFADKELLLFRILILRRRCVRPYFVHSLLEDGARYVHFFKFT
jgi:hypothetical protein